jgi:cytoskeletal protein CcmA (bactofilin family)
MARARWWSLAATKSGIKPRRTRKRVREVFLGPEIVLSGELKLCDTLVAEGIVDSGRIDCRQFVLGSAGCCKGEVQAESAIISGRFSGLPTENYYRRVF